MIALDTNVILRLVTADDPDQLQAAREVFESGDLWISKTVLLEVEWVLRYTYELGRPRVGEIFYKLLGYPRLQVEDRSTVLRALAFYDQGLDFADALHLSSSGGADRFVTFDRPLARRARRLESSRPVVLLKGTKTPTTHS